MMPIIPMTLVKAIGFLLRWGPTALSLIEEISNLIRMMKDDEDAVLVTKNLAAILAYDTAVRSWRVKQLQDLKCRAEACKLR